MTLFSDPDNPRRSFYVAPNGAEWTVQHSVDEIRCLLETIEQMMPDAFLVIGTWWGGLEAIITEQFPALRIETRDVIKRPRTPEQLAHWGDNVHFATLDCLTNPFPCSAWITGAQGVCPDRMEYTDRAPRLMLYCDGGNKFLELAMYARLMRQGDLVGVHDWPWACRAEVDQAVKHILHGFESVTREGRMRWWRRLDATKGSALALKQDGILT